MKFNTRFNLRKQKSKKPEKIYLICRFNGEKFVYPTAFNILPKHWNTKAGEIRNVIEEPNRDTINTYLRNLKTAAKNIYERTIADKNLVIKQTLKTELDKWTGKTTSEKTVFSDWVQSYIDKSPERIDPKTGIKINYRTVQKYKTTLTILKTFEKDNRQKLDFETITISTLTDFRDYLTSIKKYTINSVAKYVDIFRHFLRAASNEKISIDPETINPGRFTLAKEKPQDIYLTESELQTIAAYDFTDSNKFITINQTSKGKVMSVKVRYNTLDRVRDLFLIGCYTGLRVSDYNNIQSHHIKEKYIDLHQQKTRQRVVIPIHKTVKTIISKYGGNTPPKISDQKLNQYIKEICKLAGITEPIEKQQTKGGEKISIVLEKWQLVASHTARRSFATNMTKQGIPIQFIMKITGHKKESVFLEYVKLSPLEHAEILQKHLNTGMNSLNSI